MADRTEPLSANKRKQDFCGAHTDYQTPDTCQYCEHNAMHCAVRGFVAVTLHDKYCRTPDTGQCTCTFPAALHAMGHACVGCIIGSYAGIGFHTVQAVAYGPEVPARTSSDIYASAHRSIVYILYRLRSMFRPQIHGTHPLFGSHKANDGDVQF